MNKLEHCTIALAGVFQSATLVRQIAHSGLVDQASFEKSIQSILQLDADSTEGVYGGLNGIRTGLQSIVKQFGENDDNNQRDMELMRYALNLTLLERKLIKNPEMLDHIQKGIQQAVRQADMYGTTHPNVIANLAGLYSDTLSTFRHRILVTGEQRFLENEQNASKIRALLLAGVRSAVLWRQKGGSRWQFLFSRSKILKTAQRFLDNINPELTH